MDADLSRALSALHAISPDTSHDEWVRVGMAAQAAGLSFDDFNDWSAKGKSYSEQAARTAWRGFKPGKGIGAGTLFYTANGHGWRGGINGDAPAKPVQAVERASEPRRTSASGDSPDSVWARCDPATHRHSYFVRKGADSVPLDDLRVVPDDDPLRINGVSMAGALAKRVRRGNGSTSTLQFILPVEMSERQMALGKSDKLNFPGFPVEGCFIVRADKPGDTIYVCEGIGAAWSCWKATGAMSVDCCGAGRMRTVACELRQRYPSASLVLVLDRGKEQEGEAIACTVKARVLCMPEGEVQNFDANDFALREGHDALAELLEYAREPLAAPNDWAEPMPLPDALPPVQRFDAQLLPEVLRVWVMDIAHRMQCPPDFPAVGTFVALSSLIGARAVVQPKVRDDWQVVPNLWGACVGRPGVLKSPALHEAIKQLHRLQVTEFERHETAHASWALDNKVTAWALEAREKEAKALADKSAEKARELLKPAQQMEREPIARRFIVNDATVEKLCELLAANPWGFLCYRDELYGLLTSLDRPGQEGSRSFYLQGYDGNQGYTQDRIGRGTTNVPRVCFAMLGSIQPGRVQEYVRSAVEGGSGDDGLLQRFGLTVWPDVAGEFVNVDQWPDGAAKADAQAVFERLAKFEPMSDTEPRVWHFDPEAQVLFDEWRQQLEQELRGGQLHPALESHLAKYRKLVPALALIFAMVDTPDAQLIGKREMMRAAAWAEYLRTHAERLYSVATMPHTGTAAALLQRIKVGAVGESFTPREVAQKGWTGLATPDAVRKAAGVLVEFDWLRREIRPSADLRGRGRPSERYAVNPATLKDAR